MTERAKKGIAVFLCIAGVWVLLGCLGIPVAGLDVLVYLIGGWARFLIRVLPKVSVRWGLVGDAAVYIAVLVAGTHCFLRWLYREMKPAELPASVPRGSWQIRWTLGAFVILFLMFASGMAAIGIAHQTFWLMTSPEPIFESRGREVANRVKCMSNLRQIGYALQLYAKDQGGHYPDDLAALLREDLPAAGFVCPSSNDVPAAGKTPEEIAANMKLPRHCSYLYFGKGLAEPIDPNRVIAFDEPTNHQRNGINVLYGDGRVTWLSRAEAEALLQKLNREAATGSANSGR